MAAFTRVSAPDRDCVTVMVWSRDGAARCRMLGPVKPVFGHPFELDSPGAGFPSVPVGLAAGQQFAVDVAVPLVVCDPEGIWDTAWGTLQERLPVATKRAGDA